MRTAELFPPCFGGSNCPDSLPPTDAHHHILDPQRELLDCTEKYVAMVGGFGSSKTTVACVLGHLLSVAIPGNMGMIARRSLPKLHDATERIYLEILDRSGEEVQYREVRDGWPGRLIYPNGSEVLFRETKDLGRFLGPEFGWFLVDEAQEEPERTFKDLSGRLRLPRAAAYLKGMLCTNPPHKLHWIARLFPNPGAWVTEEKVLGKVVRIGWRMIRSSTLQNPFLDPEYVATLLRTHSPQEVKRIIEGFYGFAYEGSPVYPQFEFTRHVGDPPAYPITTYRVWDFGFHRPATTWHQMFRCAKRSLHWNILQELIGQDEYAEQFAPQVLSLTKDTFGFIFPEEALRHMVVDGGDAAGAQVETSGPGPIIRLARPRSEGGFDLRFNYQKFADITTGLDLIRDCLRVTCKCGIPLLTIHRRCVNTIEALAGGYHYAPDKPGKETSEKPVKDGFYDNLADTVRYAGELFYRNQADQTSFPGEVPLVTTPSAWEDSWPTQ